MKTKMMPTIRVAALAAGMPANVMAWPKNDAGNIADILARVEAKVDAVTSNVKEVAEKAVAEAKAAGVVSAKTKEKADELLVEQGELKAALEKLTAESRDLAQRVAETGPSGAGGPQSFGAMVLAQGQDDLEAFVANGATGSRTIKLQGAITTAGGSGGGLIFPDEERAPVQMPQQQLRIVSLVGRGRTGTDQVPYVRQTLRADATQAVAEGGTYQESDFGWDKAKADVKKIGAITQVTEETLADADQLETWLDIEMRYGLDKALDQQILTGDGTGENLHGLIPNATPFAAAAGGDDSTRIDRLRLAILQVQLADFMADSIVLHPTAWTLIEQSKDADGRYIFANPQGISGGVLWGLPVATSKAIGLAEFLVGELKMAATLYDRQAAEVIMSSEDGSNFVQDMVTLKARLRAALAVKRPAAMVTGNFTGL